MVDNVVFSTPNTEFYYSNVSPITTNFNVNPYNDDFDEKKNYYRILFKPGYAVQGRELIQVQTMLQDQIQKFGRHVFQEGSQVLGGKYYIDTRAHYVKVNDTDADGQSVDVSIFQDQIVTGQVTGIQAYVNYVLDGSESTDNPKTLYVSYLSSNPDTDEFAFTANEPLSANVGTLVVGNNVPVGYGSIFTINEGVRFAKQHFIYHPKQTIVIDRYDINPSCRVGFTLVEDIVTYQEDSSLLDPAQEASNYAAPGADRFRITPVLTRLDIDDTTGFPDYVNLFVIRDGAVVELSERPTYNIIQDEIAKRTMDESGDYYVRGFNVIVEEHLDQGNGGYLTYDRGGDFDLLSVQVEPGTAYVKGYEINKLVTSFLTVDKAEIYNNVAAQIISSSVGNYITLKEAVGAWNLNTGQSIDLYDTAQKRISGNGGSTAAQTGKKIGSAKVMSLTSGSGLLGTANGTLNLHIFDIQMLGANSFSDVRSVYSDITNADLGGDVVLSSNNCILKNAFIPSLAYVGSNHTKTIRTYAGDIDTTFTFKKTSDVSIAAAGTFSLSSSVASEVFPYGSVTLSSAQKREIFLTLNSLVTVTLGGTALSGATTTTLTGSGTTFTKLNVGDKVRLSGNNWAYSITSITSDTVLTTDKALPAVVSGNSLTKVYLAGDMIDLTSTGYTGAAERSVTCTGGTSLSFNLNETLSGTVSGTVSYNMWKTGAKEISKKLKTSRYVTINCAANLAGTSGPFDLGFSDVYRLRSVRKSTSVFTATDEGTDVSGNFIFDNGQRDNFYGHGTIKPVGLSLTTADKLLVCLDYFQPDYTLGSGYFSVDSYPINDENPQTDEINTVAIPVYISRTTGFSYDLRNYLDFRPVYTNTAADSTTVAGATGDPVAATTLQYESAGLRLPAEAGYITFDYSYYLPRRDVVAVDSAGNFQIIKGVPSVNPITPSCPMNLMSLAKLYVSPYPSISTNYAQLIQRNDLACSVARTSQVRFTMKDIGVLKQRIDNLENYVSLSLLEKSAMDLKILDENGLDRFKNGIFVDSFTSFETSDYGNPDHHICYDPKEGSIRPLFDTQAIGYELYSATNIVQLGDLIMLPYTEAITVQQPYATTYRNVETTVFRFVGRIYLDPDSDYWVNTDRLASQTYHFGALDSDVTPYSIVYGSWQTTVTGVTRTDPILISSTTAVKSSSSTTNGLTGTWSGPALGAVLPSLIATYGGDTPVTLTTTSSHSTAWSQVHTVTLSQILQVITASTAQINTNGYLSNPDVWNVFGITQVGSFPYSSLSVTIVGTGAGGIAASSTVTSTTTTTTNTYQTITSTSTQATRTFTETFQTLQTESQSFGDKVITVAPIADIRPQTIAFEGRGLKASTKHYVYFDGQLMSSYVTPGTMLSVPTNLKANTNASLITRTGPEGTSLYSNDQGFIYGFLRIPADSSKTFRTGSKQFIVTDSPTNEPDATSAGLTYFNAQGITQTVQEQIVTTGTVITTTKSGVEKAPVITTNTTNTYVTTSSVKTTNTVNTKSVISTGSLYAESCMAYSFKLNTPRGEEGTFLSSVDVFFQGKDPTKGVWFEIRVMGNDGTISQTQVPGSEVWLSSSDVNTSDDGATPTNVKFQSPVFLSNGQEYAFIIHTVGINPNYYMFVSVLGEKDILTQRYINERPLTGTLFTTNNNTDWDMVPRVDLKVTFYRAVFSTGVVGEAIIGNQHRDYVQLPLDTKTAANTAWFGERIFGTDTLTLSAPTGGSITVGSRLVGSQSTANSSVMSINGSDYKMSQGGYTAGETVTCNTGASATVIAATGAAGGIYKAQIKSNTAQFSGNTIIMTIDNSNGLFVTNDTLKGEFSSNSVTVLGVSRFVYSTVQFEPSYLNFLETTVNFSMSTRSNTGTLQNFAGIVLNNPTDFDDEMAIYSRTDEVGSFGSVPSNRVKVQMSTQSDYISPVVNLKRTYSVYIHNLINSNTSGELASAGGGLKDKYISQVITLAEGQDAEDLRVLLTAYRPPASNADIKVYARIANNEDFESIYQRSWIELEAFDSTAYSSLANRKDWREFQFKFPASSMVDTNDQGLPIVGYTNSVGTTFATYKQYQIKIGLQSDNSAIVPRVADLRCICLQV